MGLKQLTAITEIHLTKKPGKAADPDKGTPAVRPEVQVIKAGTQFKAMSKAQEEELIGMGAARHTESSDDEDDDDDEDAELAALRAEYEDVLGEAPRSNMKADTMRERIEEARTTEQLAAKDDETDLV